MFEWLDMVGNYDQRVVKNTIGDNYTLDTALVTDKTWKYETAISHGNFNHCGWIVLEGADTEEEAIAVHDKWLNKLRKEDITEFIDCYTGKTFKKEEM